MLPLLTVLSLTLVSLSAATFDVAALPGSFRLLFGLEICPDKILFTQPGLTHPSSTLVFDTLPLQGGTLNLLPSPATGGSGLIRHFAVNPNLVGLYYGGVLSSRIQWATSALGADAYFVFFSPDVTFRITWEDVIGVGQPLETVSGQSVYWFQRGTEYVVINNRCLLVRESRTPVTPPTDGSNGASNGNGNNGGPVDGSSSGGGASCFPAAATVQTEAGVRTMDQLQTGERVWTGRSFSEVFAWTHRDARARGAVYQTIVLENGRRLTLTPGHYVYVDGPRVVPADKVQVGDIMETVDGAVRVAAVEKRVVARGLYNPQTMDGDIVVDGVRVSTYTTAVEGITAHALLAPVRMCFRVWTAVHGSVNSITV